MRILVKTTQIVLGIAFMTYFLWTFPPFHHMSADSNAWLSFQLIFMTVELPILAILTTSWIANKGEPGKSKLVTIFNYVIFCFVFVILFLVIRTLVEREYSKPTTGQDERFQQWVLKMENESRQ
jgi:hypothetical protein